MAQLFGFVLPCFSERVKELRGWGPSSPARRFPETLSLLNDRPLPRPCVQTFYIAKAGGAAILDWTLRLSNITTPSAESMRWVSIWVRCDADNNPPPPCRRRLQDMVCPPVEDVPELPREMFSFHLLTIFIQRLVLYSGGTDFFFKSNYFRIFGLSASGIYKSSSHGPRNSIHHWCWEGGQVSVAIFPCHDGCV